jgi:hypothetical protein
MSLERLEVEVWGEVWEEALADAEAGVWVVVVVWGEVLAGGGVDDRRSRNQCPVKRADGPKERQGTEETR